MMHFFKRFYLLITLSLILIFSCDDNQTSEKLNFDRKAFLSEAIHYVITPEMADAWESSKDLKDRIDILISQPTVSQVLTVKSSWKNAFIQWQSASVFNFGPAESSGLKKSMVEELGVFPISESKIDEILSSGVYNLNDFNRDARGISAIEYLLYGIVDSDTLLAEKIIEDEIFSSYLIAVVTHFSANMDTYFHSWNSERIEEFITNDGTDAGSSTSVYYNEFVKSFEALKNFKVGLPIGLRPGQTQSEPNRIEGFYSKNYSIEALKVHFGMIQFIWTGPEKGIGFKEYLRSVVGGSDLINSTELQFEQVNLAFSAIEATEKTFVELVETNDETVITLHTELQKLTRFLKSDMSSLMGIAITYTSSDGD
jgi:uncharacterized protein